MKKTLYSLSAVLIASAAYGGVAEDARQLMDAGNYDAAIALLRSEIEGEPNSPAVLYMLAGECTDHEGLEDEAAEYFRMAAQKGLNLANARLANIAFRHYDFNSATNLYAKYARGLKKGASESEDVVRDKTRLSRANEFFQRVEKIEIIDSIAVDKGSFFKAYKLSASAGNISDSTELPFDKKGVFTIYTSETGDLKMWNATASDGKSHIMESIRLTDGSWHEPMMTPDILNDGGDAAYPYMMPDGSTLYFASNGENSIGGYDIFISNRDSEDGSYMTPQNLGMPYNSPYDDYMLVIDENAGVGWWATDRNRLPDNKITVYAFVPNDIRINVDPNSNDLLQRAKLTDYKATQLQDKDYKSIISGIDTTTSDASPEQKDFILHLGRGVTYSSYSDFKSADAVALMRQLVRLKKESAMRESELKSLRRKYYEGNKSLSTQIAALEKQTENDQKELQHIKKEIIKIEVSR